uniref:Uncharacterized protein n=1 Tax=Grammatophora oceanica TaxID=210454 RepID=A0A7S1UVB9_9STRA|mmetsp:Transcript_25284/g.36971  ORF Transcript_25284/g.36971 Transcript_25284/m.36971 type:complete len:206 (+) Transcript_25284:148-765(+)|eukprot:CAMPEP_0194047988 /NCGR_PEP_ID=MMETSP0009_2-20130614/26468_1 /TAXON_ID=210454 /ORGANISM="Grammatophora oceanica, Strain CCMP 410" /LENGTH=205 /DNA_ID=CAMNT_0038693763 /DNA_START=147 /DNA_END=764 /DNA_ORIENTATION=+
MTTAASIIEYESDTSSICCYDSDMADEHDDEYDYQLHQGHSLDTKVCDCCGRASRRMGGYVNRIYGELFGEVAATYNIHQGVDRIHDPAVFDIIMLPPGCQSTNSREGSIMVSFSCDMTPQGRGKSMDDDELPAIVQVFDASKRPNAHLAEQALAPCEVTEDIQELVKELLEVICEMDGRIDDLRDAATVDTASTVSLTEDDLQL